MLSVSSGDRISHSPKDHGPRGTARDPPPMKDELMGMGLAWEDEERGSLKTKSWERRQNVSFGLSNLETLRSSLR